MNANPHANTPPLTTGAPLETARLAVVLLHGRGSSAEDILGLPAALAMNDIAYVAPQAAGHTWYPLSFLAPREANEPFLSSALTRVDGVVRDLEHRGVPRNRIVIAGFSQGACLASQYVAGHPARYGALLAFTGGLIGPPGSLAHGFTASSDGVLAGTPALLMSGDPDPHVPWSRVEESAAILGRMGAAVSMHRYAGRPHTISANEVHLARELLLGIADKRFPFSINGV